MVVRGVNNRVERRVAVWQKMHKHDFEKFRQPARQSVKSLRAMQTEQCEDEKRRPTNAKHTQEYNQCFGRFHLKENCSR